MLVCCVESRMEGAREEMSPFLSHTSGRRDPVFCPKPRRTTNFCSSEPIRPIRRQLWQKGEPWDPSPGAEVLDIILAKGSGQATLSPPYFCGSPPSRAANPLVLDARFGEENAAPHAPLPMPTAAPSTSAGGRKRYVRAKRGANPAAVRVEGFDCRDDGGGRGGCNSRRGLRPC